MSDYKAYVLFVLLLLLFYSEFVSWNYSEFCSVYCPVLQMLVVVRRMCHGRRIVLSNDMLFYNVAHDINTLGHNLHEWIVILWRR